MDLGDKTWGKKYINFIRLGLGRKKRRSILGLITRPIRLSKVGGDFSVKSSAGKERAGIALSVYQQRHELEDGGGLEVRFSTFFSPAMAVIQTPKAGVSVMKRPKLTSYLLPGRRL
jgi:hypothetical protein